MALSIRSAPSARTVSGSTRSRARVVVARATLFDDIAAGFMRIFTPFRVGNKEDWQGTETPFTGRIQHHGEAGSKRPFKDGWVSKPQAAEPEQKEGGVVHDIVGKEVVGNAAHDAVEASRAESSNVVEFMNKAAENVVAHNFTGDRTEPEHWKKPTGDSTGWKGDIHTRGKEGFHSTKN